jgi:hypothetical protein
LRPNGAIYIVDFTPDSDIGPPAEHRLEAATVIRELRSGGLETELVKENLPKQYIVRGRLEK